MEPLASLNLVSRVSEEHPSPVDPHYCSLLVETPMHLLCPARVVPSLILAFVFAVSLTAHATTPGSPGVDRDALLITSAVVDPSLERVAEGYVEWIRVRARQSGARVVAGGEVRRAVDELRRASPQADLRPDQGALLELAQRSDVGHALLVDLRARHGAIDVDLRLYRVAERKLVGGGLVQALAGRVGHETEQALGVLERRLGLELTQQAPHALRSINLAALTAASRALVLIDRGELGSAWRELGNGSNPLAASLRDQIDRLAARPTTSPVALAHLENARGEAARAWEHVAERVHEAHGQPAQAASTLIAAGDAQLAIGGLGKARAYYDRVLEVEPRNAQATLGVARVLATERKPEAAREVLDRVAALDVDSPVALELAAETVEHDPALRAQYLMRAASRRARRLDTEVAQRQWAQAVKLDVTLEGPVARHAADLHAVTGDYENALEDYGRARGAGEVDPGLLVAEARTQRAAGMPQQAAVTLETVLQDHDPEHEDTLLELGDLYIEGERPAEAVALLERASANAPEGPRADRTLARALTLRGEPGDHPRALQLLTESNDEASWETRDLRTLASLQAEAGDFDAATRSLERAIGLRELDPAVQQDIVALMNEQGDTEAAGRWASRFSHSGLGQFVESDLEGAGDPIGRHLGGFDEIAALVDSFAKSDKPPMKVVLQGVREPLGPRGLALDMLMPRTTDMASVMAAINETLAPQYVLIEGAELGENFRREVENLFAFDEQASLSVRTLTDLNLAHGSDAVFVARITRKTGESDAPFGSCWASDHYLLEMRRLAGQTDDQAQVLSNQACLAGGAAGSFGTWNRKAAALYGVLCMLLVFPFLRGWGRLRVDFQLPEGAAAFFAVSLTRHPSKVRDRSEKTRASATNVFRNRLRRVRRSERRLEGNRMEFRWVPARRGHYYVTIRGPLVDLASNSLIGEFLEE
ncbi:MAG: tetratricopeptide repeat protein, partial [bacterium]|nr:tetratricopeptide repeat protein [bacterium]